VPDESADIPAVRRQHDLIADAWKQAARVRPTFIGTDSSSPTHATTLRSAVPNLPAEGIPGYRFVGELHRGGQGVVFEAVQISTGRIVAVKLMRSGPLASAAEKFRFEREVQILAQLRHPNIVTIHDSGHAAGCDYFVMDYIAGSPLDEYMAVRRPPLAERLSQFVKICDAVNLAHLQGVIHRDLKPGNIRVDDAGQPHVLDFGLAKLAVDPALSLGAEGMTQTGQFVGSLPWASPEQAEGRVADVDVRTDVYSLGVLLYQMLTGCFPYPLAPSITEAVRVIATREPDNPRAHNHEIDAELATIVLKCLRKERERRYQSAGELGRDIQHYLRGEPIEAKRDSFGYVLRKHIARRKLAATVVAAFFLTVCVGFVVSLHFWRQALIAADGQRSETVRASQNEARARVNAEVAAKEAAKARAVADFLTEVFESGAPVSGARPDYTVREAIDAAAARLDAGALADQPEVEAGVRRVVAASYQSLGAFPAAISNYRRAHELFERWYGSGSTEALEALVGLAAATRGGGDLEESERLFRDAAKRAPCALGEEHRVSVDAQVGIAMIHRDRDQHLEAIPLLESAIEVLRRQPAAEGRTLYTALNELSLCEAAAGNLERAEALAREAVEETRRQRGDSHIDLAASINNLAGILAERDRPDEAETCYLNALDMLIATGGEKHANVATAYVNLGNFYTARHRLAEAEKYTRKGLELRRETLGDDHPLVAYSLNNLGHLQFEMGQIDEAAESLAEALERLGAHYGDDASQVAILRNNLAAVQRMRGDFAGAIRTLEEVLEQRVRTLGPNDPEVYLAMNNLGQVLADAGELERAESLLASAAAGRQRVFGQDAALTLMTRANLAGVIQQRGRLEEALEILLDVLAARERTLDPDAIEIATTRNDLGNVYRDLERLEDAEREYRRAVATGERKLPEGHWQRAMFTFNLGVCLALRGDLAAAEPLVRSARQSFVERFGAGHPYTQRADRALAEHFGESPASQPAPVVTKPVRTEP